MDIVTIKHVPIDIVSALFEYAGTARKICVLDDAMQKEVLYHESNLYSVLSTYGGDDSEKALYVPDVVFERNGEKIKADVLSCACPERGVSERVLANRLRFMASILKEKEVDTLIAGTWGKQDPKVMANLMVDFLRVPKMILAIPDKASYDAFVEVLEFDDF